MEHKPPLPVAKTLLLCRDVFEDSISHEFILVAPIRDLQVAQVPTLLQVGVYIEVTSGHGDYRPTLQLRDLEEQIVWSQHFEKPFGIHDPLRTFAIRMFRLSLCIPRHGKYDFVLLVNHEEIARRPLWVRPPNPPPA